MKLEGRIYLIGMPGCGKSYFGKQLMAELNYEMIDLDHEIETKEGRTISEIFSTDGEDYFRKVESETLKSVSEANPNSIISTGGGSPCFHDGINFMKANGVVVFLETSKETLIERLARKDHRPLVQGDVENRVNQLLEARLPIYKKAHLSISHREVSQFMQEVAAL